MTVGKLRDALSKFPADARVMAYWETDDDTRFLEIEDVAAQKGTPCRDSTGKPGFTFDATKGIVTWVFVHIAEG
jgi:hypothetical protein